MSRDPGEGPDEDEPSTTRDPDRADAADPAATAPSDDAEETDDQNPAPESPADAPDDPVDAPDDQADDLDAAADPDDESDEPAGKRDESQEDGSEEPDSTVDKSEAAKDGAETDTDGEEDGESNEEAEADKSDSDDSGAETDGEEDSPDEPEADSEEDSPDEPEAEEVEAEEEETESTDTADAESTPIERKTGPAEDEEQPLTVHIEEMVKRVAVVLFIAGIISLVAFPFGEEFINFLWYSVLPSDISKPHVYHPLELIITQLKAASLLGVVLALPIFVYQTYAFMRPGLYPHERRYYLAAVPTSLVLAFVGLLFGYFLVLPAVMTYFMQYSRDVVDIAFALGETFTLMLILLAFLAVVFQIPLFIMLAIMMGLTTRTWLAERRLIMWGVFLGIAFLFSPDPTGMAPFLIALTMVGLFEGTLALLKWTGRGDR